MKNQDLLKIGTCSWKYDSWMVLIYSADAKANYLKEYSRHYSTVEIDQWFWSLFPGYKAKLPDSKVVKEYDSSVPEDFRFSVKVPNSITLTHYYTKTKNHPLEPNPYFFSNELFAEFLVRLAPMRNKLGPIIFQFEYLNKKKMPDQQTFLDQLSHFIKGCPSGYTYAIETRNPNYLNMNYFEFLRSHDLSHVFLQGYYMPDILGIFEKYKNHLNKTSIIRLHGPDRPGMEAKTKEKWNEIVDPKDKELKGIVQMVKELMDKGLEVYVNVNNHYEGSAPKTIEKIYEIF